MVETADTIFSSSSGVQEAEVYFKAFCKLDSEVQGEILQHIENMEKHDRETRETLNYIQREQEQEVHTLSLLHDEYKRGKSSRKACMVH